MWPTSVACLRSLRTVLPALAKFGSPTLQAIDIDVRSLHVLHEAVSHNEGLAYVSGNGSEPARSQVPGTECRTSVWIPAIRTVVTATLKTTDGVVADNSVGVDATIDGAGVVTGSGAGIGAGGAGAEAGAEAGAGPAKSGAATGLSAAELRSMFQHTATSMIMALGHRTGLTDTMAGLGSPVSIKELATASGCAERYVKEWLGGLVAGKMAVITSESTEPTHENNYGDDELRFQLTESTAKHFPRSAGLTCMVREVLLQPNVRNLTEPPRAGTKRGHLGESRGRGPRSRRGMLQEWGWRELRALFPHLCHV